MNLSQELAIAENEQPEYQHLGSLLGMVKRLLDGTEVRFIGQENLNSKDNQKEKNQ